MFATERNPNDPDPKAFDEARVVGAVLGAALRTERLRRGLALRNLADLTGLAISSIHAIEAGRVASIETYVRLGRALKLRREFALVDGRRQSGRAEDPVHAAMGEILAGQLQRCGYEVRLDEPYQHYQFAGRGDVVAWSRERRAFLHIENRTRVPNLQEAFGSFNAKRQYLAGVIAEREGLGRWRSETHVVVALWSAEVLHAIRLHEGSFRAVCPDGPEAFEAWWSGRPPESGRQRALVVFDPLEGTRRDRRRSIGLADAIDPKAKPRYRDYAEALDALRKAGRA